MSAFPDLDRCAYCDAWFDPASLDETLFHGFGDCLSPDAEMPQTGIRGERAEPQA